MSKPNMNALDDAIVGILHPGHSADELPEKPFEVPSNLRTVHAVAPFDGQLTIEVEGEIVGLEIHRAGGKFLTVTVPKTEFMLAVRAADGDEAAAVHLRFLQEATS